MKNYREQDGCHNCIHSYCDWGTIYCIYGVKEPKPIVKTFADESKMSKWLFPLEIVSKHGICDRWGKAEMRDEEGR